MSNETFRASVQYNDWMGTCAVDNADNNHISNWLKENGHIEDNDFLVGVKMCAGENHGEHTDPVFVTVLTIPITTGETVEQKIKGAEESVDVKVTRLDMNIHEFLGLFKRFNVVFSPNGLLEGRNYKES